MIDWTHLTSPGHQVKRHSLLQKNKLRGPQKPLQINRLRVIKRKTLKTRDKQVLTRSWEGYTPFSGRVSTVQTHASKTVCWRSRTCALSAAFRLSVIIRMTLVRLSRIYHPTPSSSSKTVSSKRPSPRRSWTPHGIPRWRVTSPYAKRAV